MPTSMGATPSIIRSSTSMPDSAHQPHEADQRIEAALADLHAADTANLGDTSPAGLLRIIEQLRGSLADMIRYNQEQQRRKQKCR